MSVDHKDKNGNPHFSSGDEGRGQSCKTFAILKNGKAGRVPSLPMASKGPLAAKISFADETVSLKRTSAPNGGQGLSKKTTEAQYEKLSRELEMERQSVVRQLEKCKINSDVASISSVSDTDDSFVWRADAGSSVGDSDHDALHSHDLMDSYIKALEERGVMHPGDMRIQPDFTESTVTSRTVSGNKITKTTKTVVKSSSSNNYQSVNGHEEDVDFDLMAENVALTSHHQRGNSLSSNTSSLRNGYTSERAALMRSGSNASSIASARGGVDPQGSAYNTVSTSVLADGSLVTTYTSKTTTVHEDPLSIDRQQFVRASPALSASHGSDRDASISRHYNSSTHNSYSHQSYQNASTLPRQPTSLGMDPYAGPRSATLPRPTENYRPVASSTPESQVHEEERINPDGSRVYIRKVVTTTTTCTTEPGEEFVDVSVVPEVHSASFDETTYGKETDDVQSSRFDRTSTSSFRSERSERSHRSNTPRQPYIAPSGPGYFRVAEGGQVEERITSTSASVVHGENEGGSFRQRSRTPSHSTDILDGERLSRSGHERASNRSTESRETTRSRTRGESNETFKTESFTKSSNADDVMLQVVTNITPPGRSSTPQNRGYVVEERVTTKKTVTVEDDGDEIKKRPPSYGDYEDGPRHGYEIDLLDLLMFLKTDDDVLKANAAGYIMHLCYNDEAIKIKMRELDLIPLLVHLLDHLSEDCHRNAAGALKNLSFGRFLDDNKAAIQECGGIPACARLLYRTNSLEVREHVSGILYNLSSSMHIKAEILEDAVEALSVLIIIPLSGWERQSYLEDRPPSMVIWSVLLRNSTGVLRNVSSIGPEAREKLRRQEGLIDALVWMLRAAIAQDKNDIDNKIVENTVCILRNISYKLDLEVDRELYPDAVKVISEAEEEPQAEFKAAPKQDRSRTPPEKPHDAATTGCLYMKKKPPGTGRRKLSLRRKSAKPAAELVEQYKKPDQGEHTMGVALLWEPETVSLYIYLIDKSNNSFTLEGACGAVHNLCAGNWNWSALLRAHIRRERGLPPINELLTVEQEYIVRAAALALRNLAIDKKNKGLIGRYAMKELLAVLPPPHTPEDSLDPTDYTIVALLGTIGVVLHGHLENCQFFRDSGGIPKVMALTREPDPKREKPLRIYSQRVVLEANRVLLYAWEFKELQATIKKGFWSHSKALEEERAFKNATLKQPKKQGDTVAELEDEAAQLGTLPRDNRRFVTVTDEEPARKSSIEKAPPSPSTPKFDVAPSPGLQGNNFEMHPIDHPPHYIDDEEAPGAEQKPLIGGKKDRTGSGSDVDERAPLYAKVDKGKKSGKSGKSGEGKADSWV